jgi:hypothetical protein
MFSNYSYKTRAVYEITWKYFTARQSTCDKYKLIQLIRFACCIGSFTDTHSEYVINIAFALQLRLLKSPHVYIIPT